MALFRKLAIAQAVSAVAVGGTSAALAAEPAGPALSVTAYDFDVNTDGVGDAKYPSTDLEHTHKAFAADLQWPLADGWDLRFGFSQMAASNTTDVAKVFPYSGKYVGSGITASTSMDYDFIDFEAGHTLQLGGQDVRLFGGLRYAEIDQKISAGYQYGYVNISPLQPVTIFSSTKRADHNLTAWGLRFGAESDWVVSESAGLSVSGMLAGVALYGERDSDYYNQYPFAGPAVASNTDRSWRYGLDSEVALNWRVLPKSATTPTVSLGYSFSRMSNILESRFNTDDYKFHRESDLTLQGAFLRLGWQF